LSEAVARTVFRCPPVSGKNLCAIPPQGLPVTRPPTVVVTDQLLSAGRSAAGLLNRRQAVLLGLAWPLRPGWRERVVGRPIPLDVAKAFLHARTDAPHDLRRTEYEAYSDGGLVRASPSPVGGVWAWVVVRRGVEVARDSGFVSAAACGVNRIDNNHTETLAAVAALEACRELRVPSERLTLWTDSAVVVGRLTRPERPNGRLPADLEDRLAAVRGWMRGGVRRVAGHPTDWDLSIGLTADGVPVSSWNALCDDLCNAAKP
jgi:ribonuclease HI